MQKSRNALIPLKLSTLKNLSISKLVFACGSFFSTSVCYADHPGLPISVNPVQADLVIPDLTMRANPADHVAVGSASGVYSADGHQLTINQSSHTAILDWQSFDIAKGNTVQFVQPETTATALNNIGDANASHIYGNLTANGQVYLVNDNGFVFGPHASVNVNSLVASSLDISDATFQKGITNVLTANPPASGDTAISTSAAAMTGDGSFYRNTPVGREKLQILLEPGANIYAAITGRVILAAPTIENHGTISAPEGQVILVAATDQVYLQESSSPELRGLLVEVKTGGDVKNLGSILTERGNTTMMGFAVSQQGIVSASTSVALNGSIRLLARENGQLIKYGSSNTTSSYILEPTSTKRIQDYGDGLGEQASVTLAPGSITQVTLDEADGTAVKTPGQAAPQSLVDVEAGSIDMQSGAQIIAHGGVVDMTASLSPNNSNLVYPASPALTAANDKNSSNRVLLETGSSIDVSGVNVDLALSSNVVDLKLYSYELRNDPVQNSKNSVLYGQNVQVDSRYGTQIADISGAVANIQYSVEYLNANAGSVNLNSEGDVLVQKGANINISGGSLNYASGTVSNTELYANGIAYDISKASPNLIYDSFAIYNYYELGYTQGMNAGQININAQAVLLEGNFIANTVNGEFQRASTELANGGQLLVDTTWSNQHQQDVVFQNTQIYTSALPTVGNFLPTVYLSNALFSNGLNNFTLKTGGKLSISANAYLSLPDLGCLNLQAGSIDIEGSIIAHASSVALSTDVTKDPTHSSSGQIYLAKTSIIDSSGLWINDLLDNLTGKSLQPLAINAGAISLQAQGDLLLDSGSQLIANGGAWLNNSDKLADGKGGDISLKSAGLSFQGLTSLELGAQLSSYALKQGGILSITAAGITVADTSPLASISPNVLLSTSILESGGFSQYNLTAYAGNLNIADNTQLVLQESNWLANAYAYGTSSGSTLNSSLADLVNLTVDQRHAVNLNLTLSQTATVNGYDENLAINVGHNALISTDPKASLIFNSDANINVFGTLNAPAGNISLSLNAPTADGVSYNPNQAIRLSANSSLLATGTLVTTPNLSGLVLGNVLDGGTVSINAARGYILMDTSSNIDVSGTQSSLDNINGLGVSRENFASNAGTINLTAAEGMVLQGNFKGHAGQGVQSALGQNTLAAGGSLNIEMNAQNRAEAFDDFSFPTTDRVIQVTADPINVLNPSQIAAGSISSSINGYANISAMQISQGGFDKLKLQTYINLNQVSNPEPQVGAIIFNGNVNLSTKLSMELDATSISHSGAEGTVNLSTDIFTLGSSQNQSLSATTTTGNSIFTVNANNIDLRGASLISGFAETNLNSSSDTQLLGVNPNKEGNLVGSLHLAGVLNLTAREIYPTTLSQFSISAENSVNIYSADGSNTVTTLAAGGRLSITAPVINSWGNLLAPFGDIELLASQTLNLNAGSLTSVSDMNGTVIPFGETQGNGQFWLYPLGISQNILSDTPAKSIKISAPTMHIQAGAMINLNGGGDLLAYEFDPAPGGGIDYLSTSYQQSFAILPNYQAGFAAYDPLLFANSGLQAGESIYLSANAAGLQAGNYVLLPSYYALLPNAYLITPFTTSQLTPQTITSGWAAGDTATLPNGVSVVAGYLKTSDSNISIGNNWSGFAVQLGSAALNYSPYQLYTASQHFQTGNPQDGGNLSIENIQALSLSGQINAKAVGGGLGGQLDISGSNFIINTGEASGDNSVIELNANILNNFGVDSILIGGLRSKNNNGTLLTVQAQTIEVAADVNLQVPEIIFAATENIYVDNAAHISAVGAANQTDNTLNITNLHSSSSNGALLRVSNTQQAGIVRSNTSSNPQVGSVNIAAGATLSATGSILLDTSYQAELAGAIQMSQGQLTLTGPSITLGGAAETNADFHISAAGLDQLQVANLTLNSLSTVNLGEALNLQVTNLLIDSAGITSLANNNQSTIINASGNISLQNSGAAATSNTTGPATLKLLANSIYLGGGMYNFNGFSHIDFIAKLALLDSNSSQISINSDVNINTQLWTAQSGANTSISVDNLSLTIPYSVSELSFNGLGAKLDVIATGTITDQGRIQMASGVVTLEAAENIHLLSGSVIDTSGLTVNLGDSQTQTAGGNINLISDSANLSIDAGVSLNVSGAQQGGQAGSILLSASQGILNLAADPISGFGYHGANGGNFTLDAGHTAIDFSTLNDWLHSGGFNGDLAVHLATGDISVAVGDQIKAKNITLTADSGQLNVNGSLNVSSSQAGTIRLSANDGITVESGAKLLAVSSLSGNQGGKIILTAAPFPTIDAQGKLLSAATPKVFINNGANLDVSGGASGTGGKVEVIVNQNTNDAAVNISGNSVHGASSSIVYAMAHFIDNTLSSSDLSAWLTLGNNFLTLDSQNADLGGFTLQQGLDIKTNVVTAIDLQSLAPSTAGLLSLRSADNLAISGNLSDGFSLGTRTKEVLQTGPSWTYNIIAGADLNCANLQATQDSTLSGNLTIASNTTVRTGSGDIFLAAAGYIKLADASSTIYTAGQPALDSNGQLIQAPADITSIKTFLAQFANQGGDVSLHAGGDIIGASSPQIISDWLQRAGNGTQATVWGIDFGFATPNSLFSGDGNINATLGFYENIGALGGGNVSIQAGETIQDLSVMLPTSAITKVTNGVTVSQEFGGGNLQISAGGDITGGVFYVEKGNADIHALGAITGSTASASGPVFAIGDAQFTVSANQSIQVGTITNPFIIAQAGVKAAQVDYFSTYTSRSGIRLQSLAGDISLNNDISLITNHIQAIQKNQDPNNPQHCFGLNCIITNSIESSFYTGLSNPLDVNTLLTLYPGNLQLTALNGGVQIQNSLSLYGAANSSFDLQASGDITFADNVVLTQLDINVLPVANAQSSIDHSKAYWLPNNFDNIAAHAAEPLHQFDVTTNHILSAQGSLIGLGSGAKIAAAKATDISTALDLINVGLLIQNLNSPYEDLSTISVGHDIVFPTLRDPVTGNFQGSGFIEVTGPGWLNLWAGGNVDLGVSDGITTQGSLLNPALAANPGASITLLAGYQLNQTRLSLANYLQSYVRNSSYQQLLTQQLAALYQQNYNTINQQLETDLTDLLAAIASAQVSLAQTTDINADLQAAIPILFDQFRLVATEANTAQGKAAYQAGYDAIQTLFPNPSNGNIILDFSQIQTEQGGNITLFAPGGLLNVGLASSNLSNSKLLSGLGIVAKAQGDLNILTDGNVLVNQSRIFTLDGGNITVWSSNGNIDAGQGAKSAIGAELPIASYDAYGNLIIVYPPPVSASGIRAQSGYGSQEIGNVTLIAPRGVVDANEAGIAGNNITIAAISVIGAANIQASGASIGIPSAANIIVPDSSGSTAAAATKAAERNLLEDEADAAEKRAKKAKKTAIINTQLLGFGDCSMGDVQHAAQGCGGK